jgi:hypothetical protein
VVHVILLLTTSIRINSDKLAHPHQWEVIICGWDNYIDANKTFKRQGRIDEVLVLDDLDLVIGPFFT